MRAEHSNAVRLTNFLAPCPLTLFSLLLITACTTTEKVPLSEDAVNCGLLGNSCGMRLTPGAKDQASLRYVNPDAQWTRYSKVMIDPVTFWGSDMTRVPATDQKVLVNYFNQQLQQQLGKKFAIVSQAAPGVLKLQAAMTDAETATPVLRSVSMIIPQAHMLSNLKYLTTGTFPFVGGAQAEIRVTDAKTGEVLFEAVDKRIGGGSFATGFQWQWGDAENAIDRWCEMTAERLSAWTTGAAKP